MNFTRKREVYKVRLCLCVVEERKEDEFLIKYCLATVGNRNQYRNIILLEISVRRSKRLVIGNKNSSCQKNYAIF